MKRQIIFLVLLLMWPCLVAAKISMLQKNHSIWVQTATTAELQQLMQQYDYTDISQINLNVPRIYIRHLPTDWDKIANNEEKKRLFLRLLLPLILKVNEEILVERKKILAITETLKQNSLLEKQKQKLNEMAIKYDIFTPLEDNERWPVLIKRLLHKVDVVPPSIMLATASIYTEWGNSRLAKQANSLYLEEIWYEDKGLKPLDDENADYRYKTYNSLEDSIADRALKFNTHINYEYFREMRRLQRELGQQPYGPQLVTSMYHDNNLQNIAGLIDFTLSFYGLSNTDILPQLQDIP